MTWLTVYGMYQFSSDVYYSFRCCMQADVHVVQSVHTNVNSFLVLIIDSSYKLEHIKHSYPYVGHSLYCTQFPVYYCTSIIWSLCVCVMTDGLTPFLYILVNHVRACHSKEHALIINTTQQYELDYSFRCCMQAGAHACSPTCPYICVYVILIKGDHDLADCI